MKTALLIIIVLFFTAQSLAQTNQKNDFTIAPHVGATFSSFSSNEDIDFNIRTSLSLGAHLEYYLSDRWSLRSGLLYAPYGAEDDFDNIDKLNYLAIPINANWHFGNKREWYVNFGFTTMFILSAKGELSDGQEIDIEEFIQSTDFGFNYGIGYKFNISDTTILFAELQNYSGLVNVSRLENQGIKLRNGATSLNVGFIFNL
jgi:opacity protein-like surface antigen